MPFTTANGTRMFYELNGTGPPVAFVHGAWGDHTVWSEVASNLADSFTVLTYDRRGHGQSDDQTGSSIDDDVADLIEIVRALQLEPVHLVGNSSGSSILLHAALKQPGLARSLSIHEPPLFGLLADDPAFAPDLQRMPQAIGAVLNLIEQGDPQAAARLFSETMVVVGPHGWDDAPEHIRSTWIRNAPTFFGDAQDPLVQYIPLDAAASLTVPVLTTYGGLSHEFYPAMVEKLDRSLPHARSVELEGAGHFPHVTQPGEYSRVLQDFLMITPVQTTA